MTTTPLEELSELWKIQEGAFPWYILAITAMGIHMLLCSLAYMLSKIFNSEELSKWANAEFMVAWASFVLIASLVVFGNVLTNASYKFTMEATRISSPSYYYALNKSLEAGNITQDIAHFFPAQWYINGIARCIRALYIVNFCSAAVTEPVAQLFGAEAAQFSNFQTILFRNISRSLSYTLTYLLYATYIQRHILFFAQQVALTVFLPLGVLLRAFPLTRGGGNLFIALGIGLYFVYPLSYSIVLVLSAPPSEFESRCGITAESKIGTATKSTDALGCVAAVGTSTLFSAPAWIFGTPAKNMFSYIMKTSAWFSSTGALSLGFFYEKIKPMISEIFVYAGIYPIVVMAITLTFIKSFSEFLGAEAQEMMQGLFRII